MEQKNIDFILYSDKDGNKKASIIADRETETIWTSQKNIAEIFGVEIPAISKHIKNIYQEGELQEDRTVSKMEIVQMEGGRKVSREIDFYNLDMIIAVGYRVNSYQATQFRVWATNTLKEFLKKGFVMDDERLKQGKNIFGKDYFDELLERIKEIRASERRFYQKITDIYKQCSADYDVDSPLTQTFFATVQNKLEFAITHKTASGLIKSRANYLMPNMGLQTWKNSPDGKIIKSDVSVGKNYLTEKEVGDLNHIVTMYLDYAMLQARNLRLMKMSDWVIKLDAFLKFNEYEILTNAGRISHDVAKAFAEKEYAKFRPIQDKNYISDYDKFSKVAEKIIETGKLPSPEKEEPLSDFNKSLKTALEYNPNKDKKVGK